MKLYTNDEKNGFMKVAKMTKKVNCPSLFKLLKAHIYNCFFGGQQPSEFVSAGKKFTIVIV